MKQLLLVDDDGSFLDALSSMRKQDFQARLATGGAENAVRESIYLILLARWKNTDKS